METGMDTGMKSLIVTGGSRGIGAAVARMAAQRGYAVTFSYVGNAEAADATVKAIAEAGGQAQAIRGDVAREEDVLALFDAAEARFGRPAGLVNNAGIVGPYGRLDEASTEGIRRTLDIDVLGAILCAREAVKRMSTRHGGSGGAIVNVGSMAAVLGSPNEFITYAAAKGAVDSMTIGLAREVGKEGIRVNCVRPGLIDTEIQVIPGHGSRLDALASTPPVGRPGSADEVAESVLWLLSDAASYVTGAILNVSGGR